VPSRWPSRAPPSLLGLGYLVRYQIMMIFPTEVTLTRLTTLFTRRQLAPGRVSLIFDRKALRAPPH
jgi:hypothetical protein